MRTPSRRPSPAFVVACLALFVALGGVSYAATALPRNSVGTSQIQADAVTKSKLSDSAVRALSGEKGARGAKGARGPKGETGLPGAPGVAGAAGARGATGATGANGVAGPKGDPGTPGKAGDPGKAGETGKTGETGERGPSDVFWARSEGFYANNAAPRRYSQPLRLSAGSYSIAVRTQANFSSSTTVYCSLVVADENGDGPVDDDTQGTIDTAQQSGDTGSYASFPMAGVATLTRDRSVYVTCQTSSDTVVIEPKFVATKVATVTEVNTGRG
jgi:hypothetical protein